MWWEGPALVIAAGVLFGQFIVGYSNDLNDYPDDLKHRRLSKPLVSGEITKAQLQTGLVVVSPVAVVINLFGPLGIKGGLIYLFGVGMGVLYNFYFKSKLSSPLPYALAFAALVSSIVVATDQIPPIWLVLNASLFGVSAHFANVLKDIDQDLSSGVRGLPQYLGKVRSRIITAALLLLSTIWLYLVAPNISLLVIGLLGAVITSMAPDKHIFKAVMITALINLTLLLNATDKTLGSFTV